MADDDWYKPNPTPRALRQPKPGERVWTLVKAGRRFDCELRFQGESYGWECQLLEDGEIRFGWRFPLRAGADAEAEAQHARLLGEAGRSRLLTIRQGRVRVGSQFGKGSTNARQHRY